MKNVLGIATCMMMAMTACGNAVADNFPVAWVVGQSWTVSVQRFSPSTSKDSVSPDKRTTALKTFQVEREEVVDGRSAFVLKIVVSDYDVAFFRARVDKQTMTITNLTTVTQRNGREKEGAPRTNDLVPGDTYSYPYALDQVLFLFDVPRFVVPNQPEPERVIYDVAGRQLLQEIAYNSAKTMATVTLTYLEDDNSVALVTTQTWEAGRPWPTYVAQTIQTVDASRPRVIETLLP